MAVEQGLEQADEAIIARTNAIYELKRKEARPVPLSVALGYEFVEEGNVRLQKLIGKFGNVSPGRWEEDYRNGLANAIGMAVAGAIVISVQDSIQTNSVSLRLFRSNINRVFGTTPLAGLEEVDDLQILEGDEWLSLIKSASADKSLSIFLKNWNLLPALLKKDVSKTKLGEYPLGAYVRGDIMDDFDRLAGVLANGG